MAFHLRQARPSPETTPLGETATLTDEIVFGGRGVNGLPCRVATPPNFGHRYRSRALVNGKRSTQLLSAHLKKRTFTGTVDPQDDEQYGALELLATMAGRTQPLSLVWISLTDPSRVISYGDWFVEAMPVTKQLGVGGEMDALTYRLTLVEAQTA